MNQIILNDDLTYSHTNILPDPMHFEGEPELLTSEPYSLKIITKQILWLIAYALCIAMVIGFILLCLWELAGFISAIFNPCEWNQGPSSSCP